ncbi:3-oxoacyl-[acyl-carrier-protein] synthase 3 [Marivirga tractuosa]|uniref:Beta-ketoacyl-[acyl-carrier-protein] synthase III n=1 Tax=Marivirga tractuosa (strain ATCC 23168 / DSM 4126 / NBRC 15989 / NCIMB 1408 / VKM B-1430 / H-43) TaxID=643867 RepID=E4TVA8_MARTH|nr:beta-ketoacyl-ACP synthase III [Marivirga tractuosa]ADR23173.1 3-oxoacyl-(acyl-carrier-protein) synthase III [Marivirga tractuosa DSM 4126]RUA28075.1 MAG: ketoacyl-ACP synthase III [Bacteroidota bacterium]BDD16153.1 3-oxoacyl-[acyl-carrier-protein] synthase 3 [Marivirga tractuosa]
MTKITAAITGVHGWVPDYVLTNKELETMVETNDEWITSRTGIKERRILKGENQGTSVIGTQAVKGLLEKTGNKAEDIDLLICATTTPDMLFPATANVISNNVGAVNAFSYDLQAACSGFIFALSTASQFIETGKYKKVIVVGADKMSSIIDYEDRQTCIIFGDGGGAVLLEPDTEGYGIKDSILHTDGSGEQFLHMKAGGSRKPASPETLIAKEHYVYQEGSQVFKFAVTNMAEVAADIMAKNNLVSDDVAWLVPHQANKRIIDATAKRMGVSSDKVMLNIHKYGNTTSGTIPLCLWEYEKQMKKGDNIILAAFGGGFTWGSVYIKWAYDSK